MGKYYSDDEFFDPDDFGDDEKPHGHKYRKPRLPDLPVCFNALFKSVACERTRDALIFDPFDDPLSRKIVDDVALHIANLDRECTIGAGHSLTIPLKVLDELMPKWPDALKESRYAKARKFLFTDAENRAKAYHTKWMPEHDPVMPHTLCFMSCEDADDANYLRGLLKRSGIVVAREIGPGNDKSAVRPMIFVAAGDLKKANIPLAQDFTPELQRWVAQGIVESEKWQWNQGTTFARAELDKDQAALLREALDKLGLPAVVRHLGAQTVIRVEKPLLEQTVPDVNIVALSHTTAIIPRPDDTGKGHAR